MGTSDITKPLERVSRGTPSGETAAREMLDGENIAGGYPADEEVGRKEVEHEAAREAAREGAREGAHEGAHEDPVSDDAPTAPLDLEEVDAVSLVAMSDGAAVPAQERFLQQSAFDPALQLHRRHVHLRRWHIVVSVVLLVMIVVVSTSGTFFWNRWHRYNDAHDIQGIWYVAGSQVPIDITADQLVFKANTAYSYTIDSETKTLTFTLGNMDGLAHYCFFEHRDVLVIADGSNYTRWGTAASDFLLSLEHFALLSEGRIPTYPEGEGIIVLARTPDKYTWGDFSYQFVGETSATNATGETSATNAANTTSATGATDDAAQSGATTGAGENATNTTYETGERETDEGEAGDVSRAGAIQLFQELSDV